MATLTGRKPKETYPWLLQAGAGGALTGTPRAICLGDGSATPLSMTSTSLLVGGSEVATRTGGNTFADPQSFTNQVELTGQTAANGTSAMTRDLGRLDMLTSDVRCWLMYTLNYALAGSGVVGSGAAACPGDFLVDTGGTAGSIAILRWSATNAVMAMLSKSGDDTRIVRLSDRRIRIAMIVWVEPTQISGDGIGRFWTSEAYNKTTAADPALPGFGWKLTPAGFVLQIRNGSTLYTAASVTLPALGLTGIGHLVEMDYSVSGGTGTITGKINGVDMTSVSAASMPNTTTNNGCPYIQASNTTSGRARFIVRDIRSLVTPA